MSWMLNNTVCFVFSVPHLDALAPCHKSCTSSIAQACSSQYAFISLPGLCSRTVTLGNAAQFSTTMDLLFMHCSQSRIHHPFVCVCLCVCVWVCVFCVCLFVFDIIIPVTNIWEKSYLFCLLRLVKLSQQQCSYISIHVACTQIIID